MPVVISVGISGLMMVTQAALTLGAFSLSSAPVRYSQADLWVGPDDAKALDQSRGLSYLSVGRLWMDPDITKIEPYKSPVFVTIGEDEASGDYGNVISLPISNEPMILTRIIPTDVRAKLAEPGTVALGRSDARKLNVKVGGHLKVNRSTVRVVGLLDGIKALFGVQLIMSELTAKDISDGMGSREDAAFFLLKLRPGADPQMVADRLTFGGPAPEFRVWQPHELATSTVRYWAMESGAGTLFVASSAIAMVITLMVVSQTLGAAINGAMREYAALRTYGIRFGSVQWLVMKQGLYVCGAALVLTSIASVGVLWALHLADVSYELSPPIALAIAGGLVVLVVISNLFALRRLRHADPASLLR